MVAAAALHYVENGWVRDNTSLYVGIATALVFAFQGILLLRRMGARRNRLTE
jgi:hypothetical protein